jgi:hypothetical protein
VPCLLLLDQLFFDPLVYVFFFSYMAIADGRPDRIGASALPVPDCCFDCLLLLHPAFGVRAKAYTLSGILCAVVCRCGAECLVLAVQRCERSGCRR